MARVGKSSARARLPNRLRIIGGRWRGAPVTFPPIDELRPSPDRVRETLFNWLQRPVLGAHCLDLFAGSGALGVEALSRGAHRVTFVDREPRVVRCLSETLQRLKAEGAEVHVADAHQYLRRPPKRYDIVFLDPPYAAEVESVCDALARGWLAEEAWVYLERAADDALPVFPANWRLHRTKRAGQVGYHLLHVSSLEVSP